MYVVNGLWSVTTDQSYRLNGLNVQESENSVDEEAKREALQDAKTMVQEISHSRKSRKKRSGQYQAC